ncbi:DEKNAAC102716 [Brettanomyces naardenensis]|uniref:ER membrane protein complex subunit 3 n=1 Tax=Brettanomyces naardenensis TaxID=13370 RepID=A0A448YKH8_BRENA|nr:DEKNAAC102716 [Brettanomyces naardenensis]
MVSVPDLLLDPSIKLWVLLPISIVMVLVGVLRTYISMLLEPSPKLQDRKLIREQQHLTRLRNYCNNRHVITYSEEHTSKQGYFVVEYSGDKYLSQKPSTDPRQQPNPFTDAGASDMMMQTMKASFANWVPQSVIMWWVNFFFKGYIIMKLPFDVTANFKSMLQTSVNTPDLDTSYVSSVSWYFVNLLGLKSVYALIFDDNDVVNKLMAQQQQPAIQPQLAGAGPTAQQMFRSQLETLRIAPFQSCVTGSTDRLLKKYANN